MQGYCTPIKDSRPSGLVISIQEFFGFYLPSATIWRIRLNISLISVADALLLSAIASVTSATLYLSLVTCHLSLSLLTISYLPAF